MVRAANRMRVVVAQVYIARRRPAEAVYRRKFPIGAEYHRIIPVQNIDVQFRPPLDEVLEKSTERRRHAAVFIIPMQSHAAVKVPRQDNDGMLRETRRTREGAEIMISVYQQRNTIGLRNAV